MYHDESYLHRGTGCKWNKSENSNRKYIVVVVISRKNIRKIKISSKWVDKYAVFVTSLFQTAKFLTNEIFLSLRFKSLYIFETF